MTQFGYTAMCEQTPLMELVSDLQAAEEAGFDFPSFPTTTSRGWRSRAIAGRRGPCSAQRRRPPTGCR